MPSSRSDYGSEPWHGALEALKREERPGVSASTVSAVPNHFVRYAIVPAQDGGATPEEELALARFQFSKIHGERAKGWEVRLSRAGGGAPRVRDRRRAARAAEGVLPEAARRAWFRCSRC